MIEYVSFSEKETFNIASLLAKKIGKKKVFCLDGDLGVGKTIFAKGFAHGLGIEEEITSPTFTIVQTYKSKENTLHHFDIYRISDENEFFEIGYEEYFSSEGVCLVEWASLLRDCIPKDAVWINIKKDLKEGLNYRRIILEGMEE